MYKKAFILIKSAFSTARIGKMIAVTSKRKGAELQRQEHAISQSGGNRLRQHPAQEQGARWQVGTGPEAKGRRNAPGPRGYDIRRS